MRVRSESRFGRISDRLHITKATPYSRGAETRQFAFTEPKPTARQARTTHCHSTIDDESSRAHSRAGFEPATFGLMTPTPLKRPRNLGWRQQSAPAVPATSPQHHAHTGCRRLPMPVYVRERGEPAKNLLEAARSRTHPNRQRCQLLHRGAIDRQPASSALVAARAATATLTRHHGLRRGGRHYLHRRRRATPSLLRHTRTARRLFR